MDDRISILRLIKLFAISAKMDLATLLKDTRLAVIYIFVDLISNASAVSGVFLISLRFNGIGGMNSNEILFMMGFSTIVTGTFVMFGSNNNIHISRIIGRGQLEHLFMQPLPLNIQLLTTGFAPFTGSGNLIAGLCLLAVSAARLKLAITPMWILSFAAYLFVTMVIIVAKSYLVSSIAFYSPSAEEISSVIIEDTWFLSTFPLSGMPKGLQIALLTIVPDGLSAWFPAMCLLGRPPLYYTALYPFIFAALLSVATNFIFKKGLEHYVKKGSNRYVPYGFR